MAGSRLLGYRGQQVLDYVSLTVASGERPPSYAMIADALGMNSTADVCNVVRRLEKRGYLQRCDTGARQRQGWHAPVVMLVRA